LIIQLYLCRERENQKRTANKELTIKKNAILGLDRIGSILKEIGFSFLFVNLKLLKQMLN